MIFNYEYCEASTVQYSVMQLKRWRQEIFSCPQELLHIFAKMNQCSECTVGKGLIHDLLMVEKQY